MKSLKLMQCVCLMALLVAPIVIIGGVLVGLGFYVLIDDRETALWICAIALLVSLVLAPIAVNIFSKPSSDTASLSAPPAQHTDQQSATRNPALINQRQYIRYPLTCAATFSNEQQSGFGMLADISPKGCRLKTKLRVTPGDSGRLLIDVPTSATALQITTGVVRWVARSECGIEFMTIGPPEQRFLEQTVEMIVKARKAQAKEVVAMLRTTIPMLKND